MIEKDDKKLRTKRILSIIWKIFYQIVIIICIALILIIVMQRITDSNESIKGLRLFRVISGSMVPQYDVGEVVICKDIEISELKVGDTIVYRGNTGEFDGKIIMHNVVSIKKDDKGNTIIVTQGLYNTVGDPEIMEKQIYGRVVAKAKILTVLYDLSNNIYTFFIILMILVLNVFISWKMPKERRLTIEEKKTDSNENDKKQEEKKIEKNDEEKFKDINIEDEIKFESIEGEDKKNSKENEDDNKDNKK